MDDVTAEVQNLSLPNTSTLMDKVPTEIRVKIFELALKNERALVRHDMLPARH